jgi:hypothetical protein
MKAAEGLSIRKYGGFSTFPHKKFRRPMRLGGAGPRAL